MKKDKTILGELKEKATPNQRHYRRNDGTRKCVIANTNLNYYDEEEQKWKHTDNRTDEKEDCNEI